MNPCSANPSRSTPLLASIQYSVLGTNCLFHNRRGLAHFAQYSEQNVPVPLSADGQPPAPSPQPPAPRFLRAALFLFCLALFLPGCAGYQLGQRSLYRPDIRTVHVPIAQSESFRRYLGERLTEAVVKEVELRTPYKVVGPDAADSVLNVRLVSDGKKILSNNRFSEPRDIETDFFIQSTWVDRRGSMIMSRDDIPAGPLLVNIGQQANFVPEGGQSLTTAQQEAIHKLAQQIVGQMELAW